MLSCMRTGGQAPSRIAITTLEGEEYPEEIKMATGMTHRFYSRAFVSTLSGEQSIGAAEQRDTLTDVAFDVMAESSPGQVIQVMPNGCLWARNPGQAIVRLSAYSLQKGQLEAFVKMNVSSGVPQKMNLGSAQNFSAAQLKTESGIFYGLTRNTRLSVITGAGQAAGGIQDASVDQQATDVQFPHVWPEKQGSGFFVSYSAPRLSTTRRLSTGFFPLSAQTVTASVFSFDHPERNSPLDIRKIVGGALSDQRPVVFAVTRDWDPTLNNNQGGFSPVHMALFVLVHPGLQSLPTAQPSSAYLYDSSGIIRMAILDTELDRAIQFSQGASGNFYIAAGTYMDTTASSTDRTKWVNKSDLKFMMHDGSQALAETPISTLNLGELAHKKAFALEASLDVPQIVFIRKNDKNLIFLQRAPTWKSAQLDTSVDDTFSPRLMANTEDGTLLVAWKKNNEIYFQISKDFGATWLQAPLKLSASVSDVELVPLPCGGSGLITVEGINLNLNLRFFDDVFKTFSNPQSLGLGLKKIQIFRERQMVKIFHLDGGNILSMISFP